MPETPPDQYQDLETLRDWMIQQRWFASKTRNVTDVAIVESAILDGLSLALVQATFSEGNHEIYQLLSSEDDPQAASELLRRIGLNDTIETPDGSFCFREAGTGVGRVVAAGPDTAVRPIGAEQSNSSLVFGEELVLKLIRKLEPGINPELEVLRFLTAREFPHIAPLRGWFEYTGTALTATLGVAQDFLPGAVDGWELALRELAADPEVFLARLGPLGKVTAELHSALASDPSDPAFCAEEPSAEALALLTATVDEDIERIFVRLPDDQRVQPIYGRGQDVRERLGASAQIGVGGRTIRGHGDYHLGQTLSTRRGWVIIDFEGEPARPLPERRQKRSPLRDVAGMLRSFAYAIATVQLRGGTVAADFEQRARDAFLNEYLNTIDSGLLPGSEPATANLLAVFELEKAIYELGYELDNRPDWVQIPVSGIARLLETS